MRYLITFSYDGSKYMGYQKQIKKRTIQGELELCLKKINKKKVSVVASGRTDRGVHAYNQKAHFDLNINIEANKLQKAMNSLLPNDIYIKDVKVVDDNFHARFNVTKKEYIYKINLGEYNPIEKDYIYQYCNNLDIDAMEKGITYFIGEHDFKSFAKAKDLRDSYVRTIYKANIKKEKDMLIISFEGNGFLRYMVRNMVGLLIEIGQNKRKSDDVKSILSLKDRRKSGVTAPSEGLYLKEVYYS